MPLPVTPKKKKTTTQHRSVATSIPDFVVASIRTSMQIHYECDLTSVLESKIKEILSKAEGEVNQSDRATRITVEPMLS